MAPRLSQASPRGAIKACKSLFSKSNTIDKMSNRQPIGPSYSRRNVSPHSYIPLRQSHVDAFLEGVERYQQQIEKQSLKNPTPNNQWGPTQETSKRVQNAQVLPPATKKTDLLMLERGYSTYTWRKKLDILENKYSH